MKFKLIYENHGNFGLHIGDYFLYLKYALESCGHVADIEYEFSPGHINIVLEYFKDDFVTKVENSWCPGTGLIVIATEFLTGATFNDIYQDSSETQEKGDHNVRRDFWQNRHDNFVRLLPRMNAIWHVADQQVPLYQQAFPGKIVEYMPHGYVDGFATVRHRSDEAKDIDVLFTGTMTSHRKNVLTSLSDAGLKVVASVLFTAPFHREDLVARSKLVLNIKQHPDWRHESVTRLFYHLCNDSLLITDQCDFPTDLHCYMNKVADSWLATVQEQLELGCFTERAVEARQRFAHEQPAAELFSPLLHKSNLSI